MIHNQKGGYMKQRVLLTAIVIFLIVLSCKHEMIAPGVDQTPVPVTPPVDSTGGGGSTNDTVCFQSQILPLYQTYCSRNSGCHSGNGGGEGSDVVTTSYFYIMKGIRAKNPQGSRYYTIAASGEMPPRNEPAMSQDQLALIKKWIEQGALNTTCTATTCDTTKYTYSNRVSGIFATYCNGCHGIAPGSGNVVLSSYSAAVAAVNKDKALFLSAINYTAPAGKNMPQNSRLSDCQVQQITKWINKGMPQ